MMSDENNRLESDRRTARAMTDGGREQTADGLPNLTETFRALNLGDRVKVTLTAGRTFYNGTIQSVDAHENGGNFSARIGLDTMPREERFQSIELNYTASEGEVFVCRVDGIAHNDNDDRITRPISNIQNVEVIDD